MREAVKGMNWVFDMHLDKMTTLRQCRHGASVSISRQRNDISSMERFFLLQLRQGNQYLTISISNILPDWLGRSPQFFMSTSVQINFLECFS
mmetsp:Transcript_10564/g.23419  ORF Transcript_10564/g.23419 Transcript_10564/m.23419 type:complete len:92 (-) Transcript_10564:53-328(-)